MVDYWHGSPVAFEVGTRLAPKREREGARLSETQYQHLVDNLHNPDLVYFTTDRELARAWCVRSNGALLRVEPVGLIEPDPAVCRRASRVAWSGRAMGSTPARLAASRSRVPALNQQRPSACAAVNTASG
jgi:hypothetical protein